MSKKQQKSGSFFIKSLTQKTSFSQGISHTYIPANKSRGLRIYFRKKVPKKFSKKLKDTRLRCKILDF